MGFSVPSRAVAGLVLAFLGVALVLAPGHAWARGVSLIRDSEIEHTLRDYAAPLLRAAGIGESAVTFRLVNDDSVNAFATTEMRVFINSGLIIRAEDPGELKGVLAHEVGHLAGGHLLRLQDQMFQAQVTSLIGAIAGAVAGMASGRPDLGAAVLLGSTHAAGRDFLSFTRAQENAADSFALKVLEQTGQSARGMMNFFEVMKGQEVLYSDAKDAYTRTHPLTQDRMDLIAQHVARSAYSANESSLQDRTSFARMKAKLFAFLKPASQTLQRYPVGRDTSVAGRYAQSIAYYRMSDLSRALPLLDGLIAEFPRDAYFHELRGQMLFEHQRLEEAKASYATATRLMPTEPLLLIALAHVNNELGGTANFEAARTAAQAALTMEPDNPFGWRQLANAYGGLSDEGRAAWAMAEMSLSRGDPKEAQIQAKRAEAKLPAGAKERVRLKDLEAEAERQIKRRGL
ncbi:M48 family metalloprotease [Phaeovibrio sulfidiphilus]|uniref:M48 family metalloprotease n=1 Tax=Phaeovibrio sulfidiphilus TaxID=1220600 RepID=A0A8J7CQJ7_9PROT|nr:M48 family metalloprotease [Phaeovibrio sulfidiphilus]MBE1236900.1 M48 family metalloprotease [Phaeovibrio sulfidiphilus]